jgi:hypothetical protein
VIFRRVGEVDIFPFRMGIVLLTRNSFGAEPCTSSPEKRQVTCVNRSGAADLEGSVDKLCNEVNNNRVRVTKEISVSLMAAEVSRVTRREPRYRSSLL